MACCSFATGLFYPFALAGLGFAERPYFLIALYATSIAASSLTFCKWIKNLKPDDNTDGLIKRHNRYLWTRVGKLRGYSEKDTEKIIETMLEKRSWVSKN